MAAEDRHLTLPRQRRRVLAGTLIITGLLGCAALIFFLDDIRDAFRDDYEIYAVIPGGNGLVYGSPVWISGREAGTVTSIGLLPAAGDSLARVLVGLRLPQAVQSQIRTDSRVRVTSVNPMSERVIDIEAGTPGAPVLAPGDTLRPALAQLTPRELGRRAAAVRRELRSVLADLRSHAPAARARLAQTERTLDSFDAALRQAREIRLDLDANPGYALLHDSTFARSLRNATTQAAELSERFDRMVERAGATPTIRAAFLRLRSRADSLNVHLAAVTTALENPNSTLARVRQDTAITRALHDARAELDSLIADVKRNPLLWWWR